MITSSERVLSITPNFLNSVMQSVRGIDGAKVVQVHPERLTGYKNYNAALWRLVLTYEPPLTTAPQSLIAKLPTADPELNARAAILKPGFRENWFYRSGAARSRVHVPRCYFNAIDGPTGQSILLLEDLAPALSGDPFAGATLPQARLALESAARLHASWWGDAASVEIQELIHHLSPTWAEEQNLVQNLYDTAWPKFPMQNLVAIPDQVRQFGAAIVGNMQAVDALTDRAPKTLAHGDFRLDNIHFGSRDGKAVCWVIDWEDVFFGSGLVDVSWFLGSGLPVEACRHETSLLRAYHQTLMDEGVAGYSWEQCFEDYRCALCGNFVQGVLSATLEQGASERARQLAWVSAERFIAAVQRLRLWELLPS